MPLIDLNTVSATELKQQLAQYDNIVACLCAAWCDVCTEYRPTFDTLSLHNPSILFLWIDIEDQANVIGDVGIENFPTILMQQHQIVTFYGEMQPDAGQLNRVIQAQLGLTLEQIQHQATAPQRQLWQREVGFLQAQKI